MFSNSDPEPDPKEMVMIISFRMQKDYPDGYHGHPCSPSERKVSSIPADGPPRSVARHEKPVCLTHAHVDDTRISLKRK